MSLRIGFDLDGTLADFGTAYRHIEESLFGREEIEETVPPPESEAAAEAGNAPPEQKKEGGDSSPRLSVRRKQEEVWKVIRATPDFWVGLQPEEPDVVARLQALALQHHWEIFFITQRPSTAGDTVQRQSQRWLAAHGFDLPSVVVHNGSRGKLADALCLDYLVDDSPKNCVDTLAESSAKPLLVVRGEDALRVESARRLRIGVVRSVAECLDLLEKAAAAQQSPGVLGRLSRLVTRRG